MISDYTDWTDEALLYEMGSLVATNIVGGYKAENSKTMELIKKEILRRMKKDLTSGS